MKKNIAVIVKYFYPVTAGIETNVLETYRFLCGGWNIVIHTSNDTHTQKGALGSSDIVKGLKVSRYPFGKFGFKPEFDRKEMDIVAIHNFDIFPHFQILITACVDKLLRKKRYKLILTPHGGFTPEWKVFSWQQRIIKNIYHHTLGVLLINISVDAVRAVSVWEKAEMEKYGVRKSIIHVISNGVEDEAYLDVDKKAGSEIKRQVKSLGRYIVQVGRIYKIKNYETVIKSLPLLSSDVKFVIVGAPEKNDMYKKSLESLADNLGVKDRVIFLGVVKGVDKYYLMRHARAMVHLAIWESFCNVVNEGMSQGLACVVSDNTALPYLIKENINGFCVDAHDHIMAAKKISYVLENYDSEKIQKMRQVNMEFGLGISWKRVSEKMDSLYKQLTQ